MPPTDTQVPNLDFLADNVSPYDSPEILKAGLGFLLRRYFENQNHAIANKIVEQLENLLKHPDCIGYASDRCTYYRLLKYWRAKCL